MQKQQKDILILADNTRKSAWEVLEQTQIIPAWESIGATVHIVGSLKTDLMKNRDIDLHIYTPELHITESFLIMMQLAEKLKFKEIQYKNLINADEECIEWHAIYRNGFSRKWKFDMIHIRQGSKYDGVVERMTDCIIEKLTPAIRQTILRIKYGIPDGIIIPSIEIYRAVFGGHAYTYKQFEHWRTTNHLKDSLDWLP